MTTANRLKALLMLLIGFVSSPPLSSQDIIIGFQDSIYSHILDENRKIMIRLPSDYSKSKKSYPVLYRLDGDLDIFIETVGVVERLSFREEIMSDMIVIAIKNTDRNRDMWPVKTTFSGSKPGAMDFLSFIKTELIPHIDSKYRTTDDRILCGQSLSSVFTIYSFLKEAGLFDSYIACSAGFPDCEDYFTELANKMLKADTKHDVKIFMTNGEKDFLDSEGIMDAQIKRFSFLINSEDNITGKYVNYGNEGHVPYQSLYHGLKFIYERKQ